MSAEGQGGAPALLQDAVAGLAPEDRDAVFRAFLTRAREEHRNGNLASAELSYRQVLKLQPDNADALNLLGLLAAQTGHLPDALALMTLAVERAPAVADFHINHGNVLRLTGGLTEACEAYRRAIKVDRLCAAAHMNLAAVLRCLGQVEQAAEAARHAVELAPDNADVHFTLANIHDDLRDWDQAIAEYRQTLSLSPAYLEAYDSLVPIMIVKGDFEEARDLLQSWLEIDPEDPKAAHTLASLTGENVPPRASEEYIHAIFDRFADSFDKKLASLDYQAPQLIAVALGTVVVAARGDLDILDGGCGTGLCAPLLRPYARRLVGVDLSAPMLLRANSRNAYDELVVADLLVYMDAVRNTYDIIVAADVLVYFGDLRPVLVAAGATLRAGGHFVFTVEHLGEGQPEGFRLNPHGRYSHTAQHVTEAARIAGLRVVATEEAILRSENCKPVQGLVVLLHRLANTERENNTGPEVELAHGER